MKTKAEILQYISQCHFGREDRKKITEYRHKFCSGDKPQRRRCAFSESTLEQFYEWIENGYPTGQIVRYGHTIGMIGGNLPDVTFLMAYLNLEGKVIINNMDVPPHKLFPACPEDKIKLCLALAKEKLEFSNETFEFVTISKATINKLAEYKSTGDQAIISKRKIGPTKEQLDYILYNKLASSQKTEAGITGDCSVAETDKIKVLAIKQPYATLLCSGIQDVVSNKYKPTVDHCKILIYANQKYSSMAHNRLPYFTRLIIDRHLDFGNITAEQLSQEDAIIGYVEIDGYSTESSSFWAEKDANYYWHVKASYLFDEPIKGRLKGKYGLHLTDYDMREEDLPAAHKIEFQLPYMDEDELVIPVCEKTFESWKTAQFTKNGRVKPYIVFPILPSNVHLLCESNTHLLKQFSSIRLECKENIQRFEYFPASGTSMFMETLCPESSTEVLTEDYDEDSTDSFDVDSFDDDSKERSNEHPLDFLIWRGYIDSDEDVKYPYCAMVDDSLSEEEHRVPMVAVIRMNRRLQNEETPKSVTSIAEKLGVKTPRFKEGDTVYYANYSVIKSNRPRKHTVRRITAAGEEFEDFRWEIDYLLDNDNTIHFERYLFATEEEAISSIQEQKEKNKEQVRAQDVGLRYERSAHEELAT